MLGVGACWWWRFDWSFARLIPSVITTTSVILLLFCFHSVLRWSVAMSTMRRQSLRIAAFLQADARPMFCWPRFASTAWSQVWLGLPNGRFQSGSSPGSPQRQHGGGPLVVSCGQYVQRAANVYQWPGGREDGIRWLLWLPHSSHGEYMVSSGSCIVPTSCQMHQCESTGALPSSNKIQNGDILVPINIGPPGKLPLNRRQRIHKRMCVHNANIVLPDMNSLRLH